jgi:hypothetical protein
MSTIDQTAPAAEPRKGLIVGILRPADHGDCSLNGVSNRYRRGVVVGVHRKPGSTSLAEHEAVLRGEHVLPRIFTGSDDVCELELVVRNLFGGIYVSAEPVEGQGRWAMAGGCYIETTDSRWNETLRAIYDADHTMQVGPIPLHDRYES